MMSLHYQPHIELVIATYIRIFNIFTMLGHYNYKYDVKRGNFKEFILPETVEVIGFNSMSRLIYFNN